MKAKQIDGMIIVLLILMLISLNYSNIDAWLSNLAHERETAVVSRIIDGDTIETSERINIRLLGINTPERGEWLYSEAKEYLSEVVLNKSVELEFGKEKTDKYNRTLAYVFLGTENINAKMIEYGFANYYFYSGQEIYGKDLIQAWETCLNNKINLCEPSQHECSSCMIINTDKIINNCQFSCDIMNWTIKGEGRNKFAFNQTLSMNESAEFSLDLSSSGGSIYLRDEIGKLIWWKN